MTVPFGLDHFDHARPVRVRRTLAFDSRKLVSIGLTIAFHVVIVAAALTAVRVGPAKVMQELSVSVLPQHKQDLPKDLAPPPKLIQPAQVSAPIPEVVVQTTAASPVTVAPAVHTTPFAVPSPIAGEGRDAFLGRLLGHLNHYKHYPRAARAAHVEGVVTLHFVMDAQGHLLRYEIAQSSGRPLLDAEALALIQRAQPLPALPADFPTRTLDAVVPIDFSLHE